MENPIAEFQECGECGAKAGEDCFDCLNHSSRIESFAKNAPLELRMQALTFFFNQLPDEIKKALSEVEDCLYLNKEEYSNWKKCIGEI